MRFLRYWLRRLSLALKWLWPAPMLVILPVRVTLSRLVNDLFVFIIKLFLDCLNFLQLLLILYLCLAGSITVANPFGPFLGASATLYSADISLSTRSRRS